ncbi:COG1778 Low specificity phosphatase (HAD superfamily) [Candidatus Nanopelagicaceae bacterium]
MKDFLSGWTEIELRFVKRKISKLNPPKLLAIDFDGCLTDDHVLVDETGKEFVRVSRKDGLGAGRLKALGVTVVIVSTEENLVVSQRAKKMKVEVRQGVQNKQVALEEFAHGLGVDRERIWAIGNDVNDISLFQAAGVKICPNDASLEIKAMADLRLPIKGGEGILNFLANLLEVNGLNHPGNRN